MDLGIPAISRTNNDDMNGRLAPRDRCVGEHTLGGSVFSIAREGCLTIPNRTHELEIIHLNQEANTSTGRHILWKIR